MQSVRDRGREPYKLSPAVAGIFGAINEFGVAQLLQDPHRAAQRTLDRPA
jgi:hypothetical protein